MRLPGVVGALGGPMVIDSFADVPTACPTCRKSSLWFEFGSADRRRDYYRCASCGRGCEVVQMPRYGAPPASSEIRVRPEVIRRSAVGDPYDRRWN